MTEQQKQRQLYLLEQRAIVAEKNGLHTTAKSWRDRAYHLSIQSAHEVIFVERVDDDFAA